jgi:myo-inositol-1(or 4)-monophosphatase
VAAGVVIAREAGATLTDSDGQQFEVYADRERQELVGSNGHIHSDIMGRLKGNERLYNAAET